MSDLMKRHAYQEREQAAEAGQAEQQTQQHHHRHRDEILHPLVVLATAVSQPRALGDARRTAGRRWSEDPWCLARCAKRAREVEKRPVAEPQSAARAALPRTDLVGAPHPKRLHHGVDALRASHAHLVSERHGHDFGCFGE